MHNLIELCDLLETVLKAEKKWISKPVGQTLSTTARRYLIVFIPSSHQSTSAILGIIIERRLQEWIYVYIYIYMCVCVCVCVYKHTHTHHTHTHIYIYIYIYIYNKNSHTHTHTHIYIYMCILCSNKIGVQVSVNNPQCEISPKPFYLDRSCCVQDGRIRYDWKIRQLYLTILLPKRLKDC